MVITGEITNENMGKSGRIMGKISPGSNGFYGDFFHGT
jgi:hypothetical protein